jgi:hypothetical protein
MTSLKEKEKKVKPLQSLSRSKSSPSKGSQEHLKAETLKNTQGLKINCKLRRACFFSCDEW